MRFWRRTPGDFFGRSTLVTDLLGEVAATLAPGQAPARLLALVGPSGSGKSSLIRAGLLPRLKAGALAESAGWIYLEPIVPGAHPMEALALVLAAKLDRSLPTLRADLAADSVRGLHLVACLLVTRPGARVVLVVDQFEELFILTSSEEERRQFLAVLYAAMTEPGGPLLVLLSLRADFYDRPLAYEAFGALLDARSKAVLPMSVRELCAVVEQPAVLPDVRLTFEPGLVGDMLFDMAGQPGALPLLEFTLEQLAAGRDGQTLTVAAYQEIGGLRGALAKHAEATFAALPTDEHRRLARALFLRLLDPGETTQTATRRRADLRELSLPDTRQTATLQAVADAFVGARLLTTGKQAGSATLEVSHEALIRAWARLSGWLDEAREDIRLQQKIGADAASWLRRNRAGDHLYRGSVLVEAQAWAARSLPSAAEEDFIVAATLAARDEEGAEAARQANELALARAAAQANRRAAARLRGLAGLLALFLIVAVGLSLLAVNSTHTARVDARHALVAQQVADSERADAIAARNAVLTALSDELVARTGTMLNGLPQVALLLSVEATRLSDTAQASAGLLRAVSNSPHLLALLGRQANAVPSVAFSPRGNLLATGSGDGTVELWNVDSHQPDGPPLTGLDGFVASLAFSPDGTVLAAASGSNTVTIWNVARRPAGSMLLSGPTGFVTSVAFSPDGNIVAGGSSDGTLWLWNVRTGQPLDQPFGGEDGDVDALAFSPDGKILAAGNDDGTIRLWDPARRQPLGALSTGLSAAEYSVAFSPDGKTLAAAGADGAIRLWRVAGWHRLDPPLTGHRGAAYSVAFSPDGKTLASGGQDATIRLWDVVTRRARGAPILGHTDAVYSVAFSPDGSTVASGSKDGTIRLWDTLSSQELSTTLPAHGGVVHAVAFSPDGRTVAAGTDDGAIRLWDAAPRGTSRAPLAGYDGMPYGVSAPAASLPPAAVRDTAYCVAFSPDGKILSSGGADGAIRLWRVAGWLPLGPPLTGHGGAAYSVVFSPDGKTLASSGADGTIRLWDVAQHRALGPPLFVGGTVWSLAFSPDGQTLAAGYDDTTIGLWDVRTHQPIGPPLAGHTGAVFALAFNPAGTILASGSADSTVRLWDVVRRQPLGEPLVGAGGAVWSVTFSPDGKMLSAGDDDGAIRLWSVGNRQLLGPPLAGHAGTVYSLCFSPDGTTLASGGADGTVRLWDILQHRALGPPLLGQSGAVYGVAFSPDGHTLVAGEQDGSIHLWDALRRRPLAHPLMTGQVGVASASSRPMRASARRLPNGMNDAAYSVAYSPDGKMLAAGGADGTIRLWDVGSRKPIGSPFAGQRGVVLSLAFSPDGKTLASGGEDGTVRLWDVIGRRQIGPPLFYGQAGQVWTIAFSPDADRRVLLAASAL